MFTYVTGGTLYPDDATYVERGADNLLFERLKAAEYCYVLTARQLGKSSLMVRTARRLRESGVACATVDLSPIGLNLGSREWYNAILEILADRLDLEDEVDDLLASCAELNPLHLLLRALRGVVLERLPGPVVVFIDEIDVTRRLPFSTDEFFAAIRACYNARAEDPAFRRLTFCILGAAAPTDLISDSRLTPFNIGVRIQLTDFTEREAAPLKDGLGRDPDANGALFARIFHWTRGHPYLTQRLCKEVASGAAIRTRADVDRCCRELFLIPGVAVHESNLAFVRQRLVLPDEEMCARVLTLYGSVLARKRVDDSDEDEAVALLKLSGAVRARIGLLEVRNPIYGAVFNRAWARENMPGAERRRQRAAFRRGVARVAPIALAVIALVGGLAYDATLQSNRYSRLLYISDMNVLQRAWDENEMPRMQQILEEARALRPTYGPPYRGFEWDYWARRAHQELYSLPCPGGNNSLSWSPDGSRIVASTGPHVASIMDAADGRRRLDISIPERLTSVAWSPDGRRIATFGDRTIALWDADTGRRLRSVESSLFKVERVNWSGDGSRIVTTSQFGPPDLQRVDVLRASDLRIVASLSRCAGETRAACFSPDSKRILTDGRDGTERLWDAASMKLLKTFYFRQNHAPINASCGCFSPDGKRIAGCAWMPNAVVWDAQTGRQTLLLQGHVNSINMTAWSKDGRWIATAGSDLLAIIWDARTGRQVLKLKGHEAPIDFVAFSPDNRYVATRGSDRTIKVWDLQPHPGEIDMRDATLAARRAVPSAAGFSPDGRTVVSVCQCRSGSGVAAVWDATGGSSDRRTCRLLLAFPHASIADAVYSPDGKRIVTAESDGGFAFWNAATGERMLTVGNAHSAGVNSIRCSRDGRMLVTAGEDGFICLWSAVDGRLIRRMKSPARGPNVKPRAIYADFSPDSGRVVSLEDAVDPFSTPPVRIRDVRTGRILLEKQTGSQYGTPCFSPDGTRIAMTTASGPEVWDARTGHTLAAMIGHWQAVFTETFSPDGRRLLTAAADNTARLWDVETGRELLSLKGTVRPEGGTYWMMSAGFSPDGRRIVDTNTDGFVRILLSEPAAHTPPSP